MAMSDTPRSSGSVVQLSRVTWLNEKASTEVFTFVCPPPVVRGFVQQSWSRDFRYGGHLWAVCVERSERHIGAYLHVRNLSEKVRVKLDFCFTIVNRGHFMRNETFTEKQVSFTRERSFNGRRAFVAVQDLLQRTHAFDNYKLLLELEVQNVHTCFEDTVPLTTAKNGLETQLDSAYFAFAGFDWNVALQLGEKPAPALSLQFCRHNALERVCLLSHQCSLRYNFSRPLKIGGSGASPNLHHDEVLPAQDRLIGAQSPKLATQAFDTVQTLTQCVNSITVTANLITAHPVSDVQLHPTSTTKNIARFYDSELQEWAIDCDLLATYVKLRIFYVDSRNVPRQYTRCVRWNVSIAPINSNQRHVKSLNGPFVNYYSERDADEGYTMTMDILVEDLLSENRDYIGKDGEMAIRIDWLGSQLLNNDSFTMFDNLNMIQKHQMRREIIALQAENYSLEKQLYSYQLAIANKASKKSGEADRTSLADESSASSGFSSVANHDSVSAATLPTSPSNLADGRHASLAGSQHRSKLRSRSPSPKPHNGSHAKNGGNSTAASSANSPVTVKRPSHAGVNTVVGTNNLSSRSTESSRTIRAEENRGTAPQKPAVHSKLSDPNSRVPREGPKMAASQSGQNFNTRGSAPDGRIRTNSTNQNYS